MGVDDRELMIQRERRQAAEDRRRAKTREDRDDLVVREECRRQIENGLCNAFRRLLPTGEGKGKSHGRYPLAARRRGRVLGLGTRSETNEEER